MVQTSYRYGESSAMQISSQEVLQQHVDLTPTLRHGTLKLENVGPTANLCANSSGPSVYRPKSVQYCA